MKVFYDSRLARVLTFMKGFVTMMFFGTVITEKDSLTQKELKHEGTHVHQYWDCFAAGGFLALVVMFVLFAFDVRSWWMLLLAFMPVLLYYLIYGIEYVILRLKGHNREEAYLLIGFEKQACWISSTWHLPCEQQNHYVSFGWWSKTIK